MLATSVLVSPAIQPSDAFAAPAEAKDKRPAAKQPAQSSSGDYLGQLLNEINARRAAVGSPPLAYADPNANAAVGHYLADLTPMMQSMNACFHGMHNPVPPAWDYVSASGLDAEVRGEVLGCPMEGFQWTPQQIASSWWDSPSHFAYLYGDPYANVVACGGYGPGNRGYATVACVTFHV
jgi:uncharacterized protein YkwD